MDTLCTWKLVHTCPFIMIFIYWAGMHSVAWSLSQNVQKFETSAIPRDKKPANGVM